MAAAGCPCVRVHFSVSLCRVAARRRVGCLSVAHGTDSLERCVENVRVLVLLCDVSMRVVRAVTCGKA